MAYQSSFASLSDFSTQYARLIDVLHAEAQGARWGLSRERFTESLHRSAEKRFRDGRGNASEVETYLKSLHLEDLALACACSDGIEAAWEFFVAHFRQDLRSASRAILRSSGSGNDARAEELADSLYAELYGIRSTGSGRRKSLFEYFHGRSKLSTWLRAVLAQRHVDLLRTDHGTISLDSRPDGSPDGRPDGTGSPPAFELQLATNAAPADPDRAKYLARLDRALLAAFACLAPRERMLLTCYYVDRQTLAEIGRTLGEHESTVSRQLERTRRVLRETVTDFLKRGAPAQDGQGGDAGMDVSQVELTFEYALEDWPFDLSRALSKAEIAADQQEK
jgi:RNA polymerase sigma-70 factor (ECF subfamily)